MNVQVTTDGSRILVRFPYSADLVASVKRVPGARWNPDDKTWRVPLTMDSCRTLRRVFGCSLEIAPPLASFAREELRREAALEATRAGEAVSLDRTHERAPDLYMAMDARPYQLMGASFGVNAKQFCLGDQPGLGKTLQTLSILTETNSQRILVSCPRTATSSVWQRETWTWSNDILPFVAQGSRKQREDAMVAFDQAEGPKMLIINHEMLRVRRLQECQVDSLGPMPQVPFGSCKKNHDHNTINDPEWPYLFEGKWDAIILDESHNLLASTYNVQSKHITQGRYGAMQIRRRLRPDGLAIALSGTPFRSKLTKSWGTLNWLRPDVFGSYWNFAGTHFGVEDERVSKSKTVKVVAGGAKVPKPLDQEAFDKALRPYYLARTKADAAPDLPPITYAGTLSKDSPVDGLRGIWLPMDPKQRKAYDDIHDWGEARVRDGRLTATGILAELTRMRQFACSYGRMEGEDFLPDLPSNKLDWIIEFLLEREGNDGKVLIASEFTRLIELSANVVGKELGTPVLSLTGKTSDRNRILFQKRFNDPDDPARVAFINTKAGGEAITLDKCCDDIVLMDTPWISDAEEQVVARIHRVSRIHPVTVWRLMSEDTVDEWMAGLNAEQRAELLAAHPNDKARIAEGAVR